MRAAVTADVSDGSKDRLHDLVEAKRAEIVHRWPAASPMDRQALLTELSQLVQLEALASGHIVQPDSALGHRHNSLVATAAQSIMANSLKIDEHQFKKQQADIIPELLRRIAEAKIQLGRPSATIDLRPMTENNHD